MSKTAKIIVALGLVAFAAACARESEEVVFVDQQPMVQPEPTFTKYQ